MANGDRTLRELHNKFLTRNPLLDSYAFTDERPAGWDAATENNTDTRDMEVLVEQPEYNDDYTRTHIHVPDLFKLPRQVQRLKNELHRKFNINVVTEHPEDCNQDDVIRVEGYGIDLDTLLSTVRRYDARASVLR